jgi:DNA-binding transcriptional LysR family regulator
VPSEPELRFKLYFSRQLADSILSASRGWLQAGGIDVRPALQFDGIGAIKYAVAAGLGVAIVPRPALNGGPPLNSIVARPLDPPLKRTLGLIQRHDKYDDPALRIVREAILTAADVAVGPAPARIARTTAGSSRR